MADAQKGRLTFRIAAVCFGLSAIVELLSLNSEALLLGSIVGGFVAMVYHAIYFILFGALAVGLWKGSSSSLPLLLGTTVFYTVDRLQLLFVGDALRTLVQQQFAGHEDLLQYITVDYMVQMMTIIVVVMMLCWWGFVAYAYYRRKYFESGRD